MTNKLEIYFCHKCGNLVEVLLNGEGELVCCGEQMHHLQAKKVESEGQEKHIPIFAKNECGNTEIRVGSVPHPMTDEHYIMFIQCISEDQGKVYTEFLTPNSVPRILIKTDMRRICFLRMLCFSLLWLLFNAHSPNVKLSMRC